MVNSKDPHRYDDMLDMPHHTSKKRPRMSELSRAVQFAPFAALTGYDAQVKEAARITDEEKNLADGEISELDRSLQFLQEHLKERPTVEITHFVPDERKDGGSYRTDTGVIKKIDSFSRMIIFYGENGISSGATIRIDRIVDIDGEIFLENPDF